MKKQINKKLAVNKKTISNLEQEQMNEAKGGILDTLYLSCGFCETGPTFCKYSDCMCQ